MYKKWEAIRQIPDTRVKRALALLNLESDFGRMFAKRFPEYFTEEGQPVPAPLWALQVAADEDGRRGRGRVAW